MAPSLLAPLLLALCHLLVCADGHSVHTLPHRLLLMSMDGFRYDYVDMAERAGVDVSAFRRMETDGVKVKQIVNQFVTKTFPNHYTLVTGMFEESHGVVDNKFYDSNLKKNFNRTTMNDPDMWNNGTGISAEPIWVTAERQGLHAGVVHWPSSDALIREHYPTYSLGPFDPSKALDFDYFLERILYWYKTDIRCRLVLLYLPEPDMTGHVHGPNSKQMLDVIKTLNGFLGRLLDAINKDEELRNDINFVLTSDHGMTNLNTTQVIFMDEIVKSDLYQSYHSKDLTDWDIWPAAGQEETVYQKLLAGSATRPYRVFRRSDPSLTTIGYSWNVRLPPLSVVANLGAAIVHNRTCDSYKGLMAGRRIGDHGYNNTEAQMRPFFLAKGPAFSRGKSIDWMNSVDVYPMCCRLLNIKPAPNNGSLKQCSELLIEKFRSGAGELIDKEATFFLSSTLATTFAAFLLVATFASVFAIGALRAYRTSQYRKNRRFGGLLPQRPANDCQPLSLEEDDL